MFERKICRNCGQGVKDEWDFCPKCGAQIKEKRREREFGIFGDIDKEFERIDKMFDFGPFKIQRLRMKPSPEMKGGGISIVVHSGTGMEPKIQVRTSGDYKQVEPEIKKRLGVTSNGEVEYKQQKQIKAPKVTEEPETEIQNIGPRKIILIKLPDVKSERDIEIKRLEQSVEVKALTSNKAYFKLIPVPEEAQVKKSFSKGILKIEIER